MTTSTTKGEAPTASEIDQLVALFNAGRYMELESQARSLINRYPSAGVVWKALGLSLQLQNKDALPALQKAAELSPGDAEAHTNLGNALFGRGQLEDAAASYRRALAITPDLAGVLNNLGNTLGSLGQFDDAAASYRRALEIQPDLVEAHCNLGNALQNLGRFDDALASYRRALAIKPNLAEVHNNLGIALQALGQFDDAAASYRQALALKPDYAEAHHNLGNTLHELGQLNDAVASFRRALAIDPDFAEAHNSLGDALCALGQAAAAVTSCRRALELRPDFAEAHGNLGNALQDLGQLDEALASYRRALALKPDLAALHSTLLFLYGYQASIDPEEYLAQARSWEQACLPDRERQAARRRVFQRPPLAGRRLRVGYVSGDYRQHAVSYFMEQLFAHHDRSRIELFAYSTQGQRDAVTERLQALAEHWVPLAGIEDAAIRERIEADGIDVLIDLSGHTDHNRLGVFARRAAPVQAHYLGYFASTGLTEMDYMIGDEILTPAGTDSHFSERVWRLHRIRASYEAKADAPLPAWHPAEDGSVWLGSFNSLGKLRPASLALWAKALHALPQARLLLKTKDLADAANRRRILDNLAGHGISADRIELRDSGITPSWREHMAYYDRLDIALDPIGAHGGYTTTCDALWMGVPTIALEGDRMTTRMAASILNAIGHPEWIARSEAEYVDKVVALARDVEQRKALRSAQRSLMAASPLCDARGLALSLENAYCEMFNLWFDGKR